MPRKGTKRVKFGPIAINIGSDPVIEDLKLSTWNNQINFSLTTEITEQIALEGLSGITFARLLRVLDAISPNLNCINDANVQAYIWAVLGKLLKKPEGSGVRAYCSSQTRSKKSPKNEEIKLPKTTLNWISKCSLFAVQDGHIMGSCRDYQTRRDITTELNKLMSKFQDPLECLHKVFKNYDLNDGVCFVADQEIRRRALLPNWVDPNIDIKMREYACLELIGRTRSLGVVFPNDKALGRYRILLTGKNLISQYQPKCTSHIVHHIIRFSKVKPIPTSNESTAKKSCCKINRLRVNQDFLNMVYRIIAHSHGRSPLDMRRKLNLPNYHIRNHLKNLSSIELIGSRVNRIDDTTFRIYRARHKSSIFKAKLKLKSVHGRSKFDERDIKAKSILGSRRSQFSQAEDSLLILSRICCLLIEPKLTKKVSFCVGKRFIRDLLHDELVESHDKTADSCLRRIKFLRKLPNNIMSINEWTAELRDDKDIVRILSLRDSASKSEERLNKLFLQVLKSVRTKLPQLLGISSSNMTAQEQSIEINNYQDLQNKFELIDCQTTSASRFGPHPGTTILQFARPIDPNYELDLNECNEVNSLALLTSVCTQTSFDMELKLRIPPVIVGLDQGNENYKQLCAKAKETTRELLSDLASTNPAADSRRALFMLRNELKQQALDKCGNLADALIVQPCNVRFISHDTNNLSQEQLLNDFLVRAKFCDKPQKSSSSKVVRLVSVDVSSKKRIKRTGKSIEPSKELASTVCRRSSRRSTSQALDQKEPANEAKVKLAEAKVEQEHGEKAKNMKLLLKAIELLLSWTLVMPGIEFEMLYQKEKTLVQTRQNLTELLNLMKQLDLINEHELKPEAASRRRTNAKSAPRYDGLLKVARDESSTMTYEPKANAYLIFSQMLSLRSSEDLNDEPEAWSSR